MTSSVKDCTISDVITKTVRRDHPYALALTPEGKPFEGFRMSPSEWNTGCDTKQRPYAIDRGGPKCPSVVPFEILNSEGPFEVASFEHFGLERPFNMVAMIVFTLEGDIYPV